MQLVTGTPFLSEDFLKFYEKFAGSSAADLSRTEAQKVPGVVVSLDWKMKDEHIKDIAIQLLEAMDYRKLHLIIVHREKKCVHKDLKPDNILVSNEFKLTLIDFGISEKMHGLHDGTCLGIKGTKMFCAPEVFDEKVDKNNFQIASCNSKRDIWSFGIILYLILFGGYPFEGSNETLLGKQISTSM